METTQATGPQQSVSRTIFKNTTVSTVVLLVLKLINFLFTVLVVRRLGDDRFGQYSIVLAFVGLFQLLAELGMSQFVMREISRDIKNIQKYLWNLVALRVILGAMAMVYLPLIASRVGYSPELVLGIAIYSASFILSAFGVPLGELLIARERLDYASLVNIVSQVAFVGLGAIFLFSGMGYIWLIIAALVSIIPRIIISSWAIKKLNLAVLPIHFDVKLWPKILRAGLPFGITSLMLSIAFSIDTVILSWYQPEHVVGWYNVAYNLIFSVLLLFGGFRVSILPSLSKVFVHDPTKIEEWYKGSFKFIFMFGLPLAIGGGILAYDIITFLYTREFLPAGLALQILVLDIPLLLFAGFAGDMTIVIGEEKAAARINTINTIVNVAMNLYFIPRFGLVGAALITVLTDLISALQFHFLLRGKMKLPNMNIVFGKILLGTILMAIPVWLTREIHLFIAIGSGVLVYIVAIRFLRLLDSNETQMLKKFVNKVRNRVIKVNQAA